MSERVRRWAARVFFYINILSLFYLIFYLYLYQTQHVRRWTQASATQVFLHQHFILIVSISFIFIKLFSEWEGEHKLQLLEFFCLHQQHLLSSWNLHSQPFLYMQLLSFSGSSMTWTAWHWFHFLMYHFRQADFPGPPDKNSDPKKWEILLIAREWWSTTTGRMCASLKLKLWRPTGRVIAMER